MTVHLVFCLRKKILATQLYFLKATNPVKPAMNQYQEESAGFFERYPISAVITWALLFINFLSKMLLDFANGINKNNPYSDGLLGQTIALPLVLLIPISILMLLFAVIVLVFVDRPNFIHKREIWLRTLDNSVDLFWLTFAFLLLPTILLYGELLSPALRSIAKEAQFALTASTADKLNKEYSKLLDRPFAYSTPDRETSQKVLEFLDKGADINRVGLRSHQTALMRAALTVDETFVNDLLARGADVNKAGGRVFYNGVDLENPILPQVLKLHRKQSLLADEIKSIAFSLLSHGANKRSLGEGLYAEVCNTKDREMIEKLLDAGASVDADGLAALPLITAAETGDIETMRLLLQHGANINATMRCNVDPSYPLSFTALSVAVSNQRLEAMKFLIAHGANVDHREQGGETSAMRVSSWPNQTYLNCLLEAGTDINAKNKQGESLLSQSALSGDFNRVKKLLSLGATIEPKGKSGKVALRQAVQGRNPMIAKLFMDQGVEVDSETFELAKQNGDSRMIELLKKRIETSGDE